MGCHRLFTAFHGVQEHSQDRSSVLQALQQAWIDCGIPHVPGGPGAVVLAQCILHIAYSLNREERALLHNRAASRCLCLRVHSPSQLATCLIGSSQRAHIAGPARFRSDHDPPPLPIAAIPPGTPPPSHRATLNPFIASPPSSPLASPAAKRVAVKAPARDSPPAPAGLGAAALPGSPKTPPRYRRSLPVMSPATSVPPPPPPPPLPCEAALDAVKRGCRSPHQGALVPPDSATSFHHAMLTLLDEIEAASEAVSDGTGRASACSSHPLPIESDVAVDAMTGEGGTPTALSSEALAPPPTDPRLLCTLGRGLLVTEPQLALLIITRMVRLATQHADSASSERAQHADGDKEAPARVRALVRVAADALSVAARFVLDGAPGLRVPPVTGPLTAKAAVEWARATRATLQRLFGEDVPAPAECTVSAEAASARAHVLAAALLCLKRTRERPPGAFNVWPALFYGPLLGLAHGIRAEASDALQSIFAAADARGLPPLHAAVADGDVDAVELLLMLGASPLARVPLAGGEDVPWLHGIASQVGTAALPVLSAAAQAAALGQLKPRPAAWQPTFLSDTAADARPAAVEGLGDGEADAVPAWAAGALEGGAATLTATVQLPCALLGAIAEQPPAEELPDDVDQAAFSEVRGLALSGGDRCAHVCQVCGISDNMERCSWR